MRFEYWPFLFLIALIPLLHRWWEKRNRPPQLRFSLPIADSVGKRNPIRFLLGVKYLSLIFFILALARPQTSHRQQERQVSGVDIMMVMDVSASMTAEDLADRSRL